ncbi:MAG: T9SS type A sorting domain-containing protein [Flavobacteriales bacterium]|nr:T9SS type A sorting domain-containing protein [Flavobacteriales bacterium]MCB9365105.1 T9SS type A sorting domain-containing protein [Flavobacteriales bacterium]
MKKSFLLSFISSLLSLLSFAQNTLSIDTLYGNTIPDTANYGAAGSFDVVINLSGTSPYTGIVYLVAGVDSSAGVLSVDTVSQRAVTNIMNDTINFNVVEIFDNSNGYRKGGNVVVIWPFAPSLVTKDTLYKDVYVQEVVGINENTELYHQFSVYPNPTKNAIYIENNSLNERGKRVRIINLNGKLIYDEQFNSKIDISSFSSGIYFLNIVLKTGEMLHYKIVKE